MNDSLEYRAKIDRGVAFLERLLKEEGVIYGVTTGYGDSCTVAIPPNLVDELPLHLTRFHGCGLGDNLSHVQARAVLATRLCSLSQGVSGVSHDLLNQIVTLINHDIAPRIPQEGSVGASGDLTPLSYLAAALIGEREVIYQGQIRPTAEVFAELNIDPITLKPKEGLALMNGTSVMTALACLAYKRAEYLAQLATRITAMVSVAMQGNDFHFDEALFAVKPHPGQQQIAAWLRADLQAARPPRNSDRLQDRYSLRCAPHVIGVLQDSLPWLRQMIENELNSANDNPIIDGDNERVLHGGHFYGGHIAMAMDTLKTAVANIADLLDRQMAQLMDYKFNNGLPFNLTGAEGERKPINHGFKAVQIGISAWTAEALKHTMPASVFSRSTECHNQDKVSMGTIASRDCLRVLELTEQVTAASLLAATQALEIRLRRNELNDQHLSLALKTMHECVLSEFRFIEEDRPLEQDLRQFMMRIQQQHWDLY
ncbi:histidine ammonia-lyase [Photobacterium aphoticum]|nr:histidine ammonia-lyase [Photobacterium aphoticum]